LSQKEDISFSGRSLQQPAIFLVSNRPDLTTCRPAVWGFPLRPTFANTLLIKRGFHIEYTPVSSRTSKKTENKHICSLGQEACSYAWGRWRDPSEPVIPACFCERNI